MVALITVWENGAPVTRPALPGEIPPTPALDIAAQRALMQCSPASMRIALRVAGLRDAVEQIAALDPYASDIWEYGVLFYRTSPFIDALAQNPIQAFPPEWIDLLFQAAMAFERGATIPDLTAMLQPITAD